MQSSVQSIILWGSKHKHGLVKQKREFTGTLIQLDSFFVSILATCRKGFYRASYSLNFSCNCFKNDSEPSSRPQNYHRLYPQMETNPPYQSYRPQTISKLDDQISALSPEKLVMCTGDSCLHHSKTAMPQPMHPRDYTTVPVLNKAGGPDVQPAGGLSYYPRR